MALNMDEFNTVMSCLRKKIALVSGREDGALPEHINQRMINKLDRY